MLYDEAIDILFTKLPMFQRSGPAAYKPNLDGTKAVCDLVGNPEDKLKFIHIAGTNGKGSTLAFIRAMLEHYGKSVHVYSSPHLVRFNERIRLAGTLIDDDALADLLEEIVSFVIDEDEGWEFFHFDFPDCFHAELGEIDDLLALDVFLGEKGGGATC